VSAKGVCKVVAAGQREPALLHRSSPSCWNVGGTIGSIFSYLGSVDEAFFGLWSRCDAMRRRISSGFAPALILLFGISTAEAFVGKPSMPEGIGSAISPAAMCGRTCRSGGRYIPGPPSVCYDRGLEYCGSSREGGPTIGVPGTGIGIELGGPRRPQNCRTVTIERDDGTVRRIRRCD
jgi:hypothetical protein